MPPSILTYLAAHEDPPQRAKVAYRFADLVLTTTREAEAARRTRVCAGRVHVMDRGYARARDFHAVSSEERFHHANQLEFGEAA